MGPRHFFETLPSTQTTAIELAREGASEGTRVVATTQTGGLGRLDHRWESPDGGLYLSVITREPTYGKSLVPLAVGAAVSSSLNDRFGTRAVLKWPNDLLVERGISLCKLGGILVDDVESPTLGRAVVIGVGLNVHSALNPIPPAVLPRAVALSELIGFPPDLGEVEELTYRSALGTIDRLSSPDGVRETLDDCRKALFGVGRRATIDGKLAGVIRGLGDEGELWFETQNDRVAIRAGDLALEELP